MPTPADGACLVSYCTFKLRNTQRGSVH
jgi:hypothetical protein